MRWVFLLLLLLNIGLFVWQHRQEPSVGGGELMLSAPQASVGDAQALRLLSELKGTIPSSMDEGAAVKQEATSCMIIGGFEAIERARDLEQRLLSLDIGGQAVTLEVSLGADHWVYIPPLASRQASLRQLRELQARQIDSYLISEGELANGILLGVFPRGEEAAQVADRARNAGYAPQVRELPRIYQEYWVRVGAGDLRLVDESLLQRLAVDFSDLKHQLISCAGVALPRETP